MQRHNGTILWTVLFILPVHDWEMEEVSRFFEMLYSLKVGGKARIQFVGFLGEENPLK